MTFRFTAFAILARVMNESDRAFEIAPQGLETIKQDLTVSG